MYVTIDGLTFAYKNSPQPIVSSFDLRVTKGQVLCILGESGSGKSTILRLIAGLEFPQAGRIQIGEREVVTDNKVVQPEDRGVGMVFQDYALFPHMTVGQNITFGLKGKPKAEKGTRLAEVLDLINLPAYVNRYPHELSGGQRQRVALARAIAPRPSLLLLDEPFSNLDTDLRARIRGELKGIIKQTNITSIFVTHDREDAINIADRVVILQSGRVIQDGNPELVWARQSN